MSNELHLGDCLDVMRGMADGSVDAIVTDPPYPGLKGNIEYKGTKGVTPQKTATRTVGNVWGDSIEWVREAWRITRFGMIVFCSHHNLAMFRNELSDAEVPGLAVWYKRNSPPPVNNVPWQETEFIWLFKKQPGLKWKNLRTLYDVPLLQAGCFASERMLNRDGSTAHPTQKPVLLIKRLLACTDPGATILDPFMGSGTTGVACIKTERKFIGIEIDPTYFAIAEKRIAEAAMQLPLFEMA